MKLRGLRYRAGWGVFPEKEVTDRTQFDRRTVIAAALVAPLPLRAAPVVAGEVAKLSVGDPLPRFSLLKPGTRTYLRSQLRGGGHVATDVWQREVRFERVDGADRLRILQRWDGTGREPSLVTRDSLFDIGTFRPDTHVRITKAQGKTLVEGFRFMPGALVGLADLPDNAHAALKIDFAEPMFNFEADLELLQTLPLARGYAVSIPFFHPVGGQPARYVWRVASEERLASPDGRAIPCWVVETDYNRPDQKPARFWLAKGTQQLVKNESIAPDGTTHRKTLLF